MANPFESASWFQVSRLRPRLKSHVRVRRHRYRGSVQYVLDDGAAGKSHRFQKGAYRFIGRLDGERTVEQLWERLVEGIPPRRTLETCAADHLALYRNLLAGDRPPAGRATPAKFKAGKTKPARLEGMTTHVS